MSDSKRPGGLTTLAVLNFVFGGLGCILILGILALITLAKAAIDGANDFAQSEGVTTIVTETSGLEGLYLYLILYIITVALIITSGVGYLGMKKTLGFKIGNLYAICSIITSVVGIVVTNQGFGIGSLIGFTYPLVTLFLLNTTFKEDFVN